MTGRGVHTTLIQPETEQMTENTGQDQVTQALAEKDPDAAVTLPAAVSEHEGV